MAEPPDRYATRRQARALSDFEALQTRSEHFQEKWEPVSGLKMRQRKEARAHSVSIEIECALE
jgi:hypothetical protein